MRDAMDVPGPPGPAQVALLNQINAVPADRAKEVCVKLRGGINAGFRAVDDSLVEQAVKTAGGIVMQDTAPKPRPKATYTNAASLLRGA